MPYETLLLLIAFQPIQTPEIIGAQGVKLLVSDSELKLELRLSGEQVTYLRSRLAEASDRATARARQGHVGPKVIGVQASKDLLREDYQKAVAEVLTPEQLRRFVEFQIQYIGAAAFATEPVQRALDLSDTQKAQHKRILAEMNQLIREAREEITLANRNPLATAGLKPGVDRKRPAEMTDRRPEQWKRSFRKAYAVLTVEQKATWKDLTGKPYEGADLGPYRAMVRPGFSGR